jgi:uncharacterized protein YbjT (DUF2867 family)
MITKNLVLVTGATGKSGGAVARELLAAGYPVRAMTRHLESAVARELAKLGAEVVHGDFDDEASLDRALAGAWGAYAVQTIETGPEREEEQGKRFAEAARRAGVEHFVDASVGSAHRNTGIPHFENKWRIEETVRGLGFPSHTILRPVFFMENFSAPWSLPAVQQGRLALGVAPTTRLQMIAVRDVGRYGRIAFDRHAELNGRAIDIAGDEMTPPEVAHVIARAANHPVEYVRIPIEQVRARGEDIAIMYEWFDRTGFDVDIQKNAKEFGIQPTTLAEWAATVDWSRVPAPAR